MPSRPHVVVRDAVLEDASELAGLWDDAVRAGQEAGPGHQSSMWSRPETAEAATALAFHLDNPTKRVSVALIDGCVVGATVAMITTLTPVSPTRVLVVTDLVVSSKHRRRGVAWALLTNVADHGEAENCEVVMAAIPSAAREPARYLTKVGFTQVAVLRAISASTLRSRIAGRSTVSQATGRMIAVRRTLRRHHGTHLPS